VSSPSSSLSPPVFLLSCGAWSQVFSKLSQAGNGATAIPSRVPSSNRCGLPKQCRYVRVALLVRLVSVVSRVVVGNGEAGALRRAMEAGHGGHWPALAKEAVPLSLLPETISAVRWLIDGRD
jgi:hypothetical protein